MESSTPAQAPLPAPDPVSADSVVEISLLEPTTGPLVQGELVSFRYLLKNPTAEVIVLREIVPESPEDTPFSFVISGYGTVAYDDRRDAYVYDPLAQQATPRMFHHGVMLPGESRRIELVFRVLEPQQKFKVRFNQMPIETFRRVAFVPLEGGGDQKVNFQHLQSLPADSLKPRPLPDGPIQERPFILWEQLSPAPILLLEQAHSRPLPLKQLPIQADKAVADSGIAGVATYWSWGGGWVVIGERGAMLVGAQGRRPMPRVDPRLFRDVDSGKQRVRVKLGPGAEVFKSRFVTREGDNVYTFGDFIEVPRERLWEFFDLARGESLEVTRESYLFDAYYFLLSPLQ